ncbi:hypothetical protein FF3_02398 [Fretibacterium fastidiosum]|uniref:Flagellar FliJ protein n=2 Tax=Fretibacterium fastidiosum TaxID=651822 RepID=A0AB94IV74_9BACT|nr:Flagellar FliJ protein [Fretibacterium fastidiosum]
MNQRIQRFDRILKLREDGRRAEQVTLAAERREERGVMDRLSALEGERAEAIAEFRGGDERVTNGADLWFQRQFIDAINTNIDRGRQSLQDVRQRILGTEARLVERHKDVRIMETYVDRLKTADFKERLDAEQLELDDVATLHCARGKRGGR